MKYHLTFQSKLYISCCLLIGLLVIATGIFFYKYNYRVLSNNMNESSIQTVELLDTRFNNVLTDANDSMKSIQISQDFFHIAKSITDEQKNYFSKYPSKATDVKSVMLPMILSKSTKATIQFVSRYYDNIGISYNKTVTYIDKNTLKSTKQLNQFMSSDLYSFYVPPHQNIWPTTGTNVVSVIRPVRDAFETFGILEYDINISQFEEILKDVAGGNRQYSMIILDDSGKMTYCSPSCKNTTTIIGSYGISAANNGNEGTFRQDSATICAYKKSSVSGWTTILIWNISAFSDRIRELLFVTILASCLSMAVVAFFLFFIVRNLTSPLKNLYTQLKNHEISTELELSISSDSNEIITLTNAVRVMLNQIRLQNIRITEANNRAMQAHYKALEAQLNPHFLYNTLSVIGANGLSSGDLVVSNMCSELASILRYSITYSGKAVSLKNELDDIRSYLYIMKMRYEEGLNILWDIDDSLDGVNVPKLILQPIVENCFQHGFKEVQQPWTIHIRTYKDDDSWYAEISNNGTLFPEEKKKEIYNALRDFSNSTLNKTVSELNYQGIGIENTIMRMHIYYSGNEHFTISTDSGFTTVTLGGRLNANSDSNS